MAEEFLFLGSVKDNVPRSVQKGRVDKRMIQTSRKNYSIKSGEQYVLLDVKERGDLYGIRIVSDNPYLEVFLYSMSGAPKIPVRLRFYFNRRQDAYFLT